MSDNRLFKYLTSSSASLGAALTALGTSFRLLATTPPDTLPRWRTLCESLESVQLLVIQGLVPPPQERLSARHFSGNTYCIFDTPARGLVCHRPCSFRSFRFSRSSGLSHYDMPRENIVQDNLLDADSLFLS